MARPKKTAETTATAKEEVPAVPKEDSQTQPDVEVTSGFLVCTKRNGSIQIHLIKDEEEDKERDENTPKVDEVRSKILVLGDYVSTGEVDSDLVDSVISGEIEELTFCEDEREVKFTTLEAQQKPELVYPSRIHYSAEKEVGRGRSNTMLVGNRS